MKCATCGAELKLLFTSWYCPEEDCSPRNGWCILTSGLYSYIKGTSVLPKGTEVYLFRDQAIAEEISRTFLGFVLLEVDLTHEPDIVWSTLDEFEHHIVSGDLPVKMIH